jgi:hypothetical protein
VALVIRIGYFCTAGHTEAGGIDRFLRRIDEGTDVRWERCFPAVQKPGPKLHRPAPKQGEGTTGERLVAEMLARLGKYHRTGSKDALDVVLFIDDADCRFEGDPAKLVAWTAEHTEAVRSAIGTPSTPFIVLFASPEIEAWFLADWEQGFGHEYAHLCGEEKHLRSHVDALLGEAAGNIEHYGGGYVNGACANKLSEKLQALVLRLGETYSKRTHGQDMLRRIRPAKVAEVCGFCFRPALAALVRAVGAARAAQTTS